MAEPGRQLDRREPQIAVRDLPGLTRFPRVNFPAWPSRHGVRHPVADSFSVEEAERVLNTTVPLLDDECDAALLCVQVLEYVRDPTTALGEMHRVLRPGGRIVVWDVDWATVSWHSSDADRMRRVLAVWDEHLADPSLPRTLASRMRTVGFENVRMEPYVFATDRPDPETYGGSLIQVISRFLEGRPGATAEELDDWRTDLRQPEGRGEYFFSCVQFCFSADKPGQATVS